MTDICEKCGAELRIGDYPFCPHGSGTNHITPDDIPGGQWFENGFRTPRKFYSHSEHRAALAAEGKEIVAKWAGPNDKHLKRWDIPSAKTLEDARILLSRGKVSAPETVAEDLPPIAKFDVKGPIPEGVQHG